MDDPQKRPSVHLLCSGVFLQSTVQLSGGEQFVPLKPLGFEAPAKWLATYAQNFGATVDDSALATLIEQGVAALPCISIIVPLSEWKSPQEAEESALPRLERLQDLVAWASGNSVEPFGFVVLGSAEGESYFRLLPPNAAQRIRLGFGNTGEDFTASLTKIIDRANSDEHFAFALSILHDANAERNVRFRIARYFSCLESLAYRLKNGDTRSRDAVRQLLGLSTGKTGQVSIGGRKYDYDVVLGSGKLRDHLYHGVPLDSSKAKRHEKDTFNLLDRHAEIFAGDLQNRVELEIARWSNGKSNGQAQEDKV